MAMMRAAVVAEHGDIDVLHVRSVAVPDPAEDEVRIKVTACALNRADLSLLAGLSGPGIRPKRLPVIPGVDIAGTIDSTGTEAARQGWRPGDNVVVYPGIFCGACRYCRQGEETMCDRYQIIGEETDGGLAEYVIAPARNLKRMPHGFSPTVAAAAPATFTTAWRMLINRGRLEPGHKVLIVGVGAGVSAAAAAIALRFGAEVYGTTSSASKAARAMELGLKDVQVGYDRPFDDWILGVTQGYGVDIVIDSVGAVTWRQSIRSLARGGRLAVCGASSGDQPEISIRELYQFHRQIVGAPCGNAREFDRVMDLIFSGKLEPIVDSVYQLDQVQHAFRRLQAQEHFGKVVVVP